MSSPSQTPKVAVEDGSEVDKAAVDELMGRKTVEFAKLNSATKVRVFQEIVTAHRGMYPYYSVFKPLEVITNHMMDRKTPYMFEDSRAIGYVDIPAVELRGPHQDLKSKYIVLYRHEEGVDLKSAVETRDGLRMYSMTYWLRYELEVLLLSRNARLVVLHVSFAEDDQNSMPGRLYVADCHTIQPVGYSYVTKWLNDKDDLKNLTYWIPIVHEQASAESSRRSEKQKAAAYAARSVLERLS